MRPAGWRCAFPLWLIACGSAVPVPRGPDSAVGHSELASEDQVVPGYGKAELTRALIAERGAEASSERIVADLEARGETSDDRVRLVAAQADLSIRRQFIRSLEICEAEQRFCPPRLDDPPFTFDPEGSAPPQLDAPLRFDVDSWRKITTELHGRACACRTRTCLDAVGAAVELLEKRPMAEVQSDDLALTAVTRTRECLFRLRGRDRQFRARTPIDS